MTPLFQNRSQRVEDLGAHTNRIGKVRRAVRDDHELLHIDTGVGVLAAVEHVHHRHRQHVRGSVEIAVKGFAGGCGGGMGGGERHAEHRIGAELRLVLGAVELEQGGVDGGLVEASAPRSFAAIGDSR